MLSSVTLAAGTAACEESRTVPRTTAVSNCAKAEEKTRNNTADALRRDFIKWSPRIENIIVHPSERTFVFERIVRSAHGRLMKHTGYWDLIQQPRELP